MNGKSIDRNEQRELIRQRIQNDNHEDRQRIVIPAAEINSLRDENVNRRVCAYCRVSTDDPAQTTSYELQKKHYEKEINDTPGWIFAGIYADEGISATSLKNRDEFNRMIADCYAGKIDVIVTKNVSRFARNVVDCLSVVRKLAQLNPPVGVKFENEGFYSLDATSELLLTVLAASAQEESKTKSNSMNWSLEKRFDNGNFLTPVLLGYDHDENGDLIINNEESITVKLMFYSYLAGLTLSEISQLLNELRRPSKKGNISWNPSGIRQILKNERYCGDILSWKTYTYDFWEHKKRKNNKNRKQVLEYDHHEAIVSRDVFNAVQAKLEIARYSRGQNEFPTLDVVDEGALQGFVSVNRMCRGFTVEDYKNASESAYNSHNAKEDLIGSEQSGLQDRFDLDGFEIVRTQFFSTNDKPVMTIKDGRVSFNSICLKKFRDVEYVELLFNTVEKCIAIRPCNPDSPNAIMWGRKRDGKWVGLQRSISGFAAPLYEVAGWDTTNKYKLCGQYLSDGDTQMLLFDLAEPEIIRLVQEEESDHTGKQLADVGNIKANLLKEEDPDVAGEVKIIGVETVYPAEWENHFGSSSSDRATTLYERIRYKGNWEILRPAKYYATAGGVSESVLMEVKAESRKLIEEMRCAV